MGTMPQTVVLSGDLDIFDAPAVRLALETLQGPGMVDLRDVPYIDCAVLTEFARCARRIGPREVTLIVASANVRKVLRLVAFEELFSIVDVVRPINGARAVDTVRAVSENCTSA